MDITVLQIAEVAQRAANAHRYDTQWYLSDKGFHVVCKCGAEFKVEHPEVAVPEKSVELEQLADLSDPTEEQTRRYNLLFAQYDQMRNAAFEENRDRERGEIRRLLGDHQLSEIVKALHTIL